MGQLTMFRAWAHRQFELAMAENLRNVAAALAAAAPVGELLDLGCDDGRRTLDFARAAGAVSVSGAEISPEAAAEARARGIDAQVCDLDDVLPFEKGRFDGVVSNQVIEHVVDTDRFVAEARRVLRPGGVAVFSTENLASWHNIAALLLGWQPFSLTNVSDLRAGLGNPLAVHRGEPGAARSWQHRRLFAARGLRELLEAHGFRDVHVKGAGYFPLPPGIGRRDPRHAVFLTVSGIAPH